MTDTPPQSREDRLPGARTWADRHLWQIQWVRDLLVVSTLIGLLLLGERLSLVTVPFLLALLFAYLFEPLAARLAGFKYISRQTAAGGIVVVTVLLIGVPVIFGLGFGLLQGAAFAGGVAKRTGAVIASVESPEDAELETAVGSGAWHWMRDTIVELRKLPPIADDDEEPFSLFGIDHRSIDQGTQYVMNSLRDHANQIARTVLGTGRGALTIAVSTINSVGVFAFGAFLAAFFFFFVSAAWPEISRTCIGLMPDEDRDRWLAIVEKMDRAVHGFIRGRLTIGFVLGIFYTIGFWLIGVPAPLMAGPAVAVLTLIPYAALMLVPVVTVLLWLEGYEGMRGEVWWVLCAPFVLYQIGQLLDDYLLTPMIQGKSTNLDTPTILFASIAGGILLGFFGLLIAIPLAACFKILFHEIFWPRIQAWLRGHERDFLPLDR